MLARHNQENLTHTHLNTAAAKPLNNHLPKTPFRSRNDENSKLTVAKGGPAPLFTTPAANRARPALGAKTTNAKALATPGPNGAKTQKPIPASTQKVSPRLKRTKVKIHAPVLETVDVADDVPDVEYCPPPGAVTPPLEWTEDGFQDFIASDLCTREQVLRSALSNGAWDSVQIEDAREREDQLQRRMEEALNQELERNTAAGQLGFGDEGSGRGPERAERRGISTLKARSAANLLSGPGARTMPSFAAPTASTRLKAGSGKENVNERFTSAKALSKTTVGYSRGRQVSATKRAPLSNAHRTPVVKAAPKKEETQARKLEDVVRPISPSRSNDGQERNWVDDEIERLACEDFVLEL